MNDENKKTVKKTKKKIETSRLMLYILFGLLLVEVIMIPLLIYARIIKILPVIFFLLLPTVGGVCILLLCRSSLNDFNRKKKKLLEKDIKETI